jgi:arginyl-tRNA synthetase
MEYAGYTVHRCCYIGDIGAHIAKWIRYYTSFDRSPIPNTHINERAATIYAKAGEKINENPEIYKSQINETHKKLEDGDKELTELRIKTRDLCLETFKEYFQELDCNIGHIYLESEVEKPGIELVTEWEKKGIVKRSQGALIIDMEDVKLGVFVVLKSNGASLYSTKDLALAYRKEQDFTFDESIYIVATEQEHHFNQVFEALRRA